MLPIIRQKGYSMLVRIILASFASWVLAGCAVVGVAGSVVETAVDITGTVASTAVDVVTYPVRD